MANRLAQSTSPYLLQHADNPVDWYPWGEEAFAAARERDVPVFLSVGYSACHWCHVMAHESFEDQATAEQLNAAFVSVKVDREERPDVDAIYMGATQAMTGQGGWPMSVMLTATGEPFFAGTYFPPAARHGMPSFRQVLSAVSEAWRDRRTELEQVGADVAQHLQASTRLPIGDPAGVSVAELGGEAVRALAPSYDERFAGFGGAPKFPPSMVCEFLLRHVARTGDADALRMVSGTLEAMARGGIYDQLAGGFARYSVDAEWAVPHFEKMLYDNALLLSSYLHWWRLTGSPVGERVARETADFLLRELATAEGGFASALDADSDGREGAFYVWTPGELGAVLGEPGGTAMAELFAVTARGNVEDGASTLRLPVDPPDWGRYRSAVEQLLAAREQRTRPGRDDKVVAAWNGLVISALAECGVLLGEPRYLEAALTAGRLLVDVHGAGDVGDLGAGSGGVQLRRVSRDGVAGSPPGVLEDYACVSEGFLSLYSATGDRAWFDRARRLVAEVVERFGDDEGGFFDTSVDAEVLVARPRDATDNATPSGQATMASVLVTMFGLTGDEAYRERAESLVRNVAGIARQAPRYAGRALAVAEALADGPRQVAVVGDVDDGRRTALVTAAFRLTYPGVVIAQGDGAAPPSEGSKERFGRPAGENTTDSLLTTSRSGAGGVVPLLEGRTAIDGRPAAYLCHDFVCDLPVTDPADLTSPAADSSDRSREL